MFLLMYSTFLATECGDWTVPKHVQVQKKQVDEASKYIHADTNLLVWGLGYDSIMWKNMACRGRTVFLETDDAWMHRIKRSAGVEAYLLHHDKEFAQSVAKYKSLLGDDRSLHVWLDLSSQLPRNVTNQRWDVVIVDGPRAYSESTEGRHRALYTTRGLVRNGGVVFVDDCERDHERYFMTQFLKPQPDKIVQRNIHHGIFGNSRCTFLM